MVDSKNRFDSIGLQKLLKLYTKLSCRAASHPIDDNAVPLHLRNVIEEFETAQKEFIQMVIGLATMTTLDHCSEVNLKSLIRTATTTHQIDSIDPDQLSKLTLLSAQIASHPQFPREISDFICRQEQMFVRGISKYIRNHDNTAGRYGRRKKEEETGNLEIIIEVCPEFLSSKMKCGFYPIHCALFDQKASKTVPLLAKAAFDEGIRNRGYLLEEVRGLNLFHFLTAHASRSCKGTEGSERIEENEHIATFKALLTSDPPLFTRKDVIDYDLLHHAVLTKNMLTVEFLADLCPEALYKWKKCRGSSESASMTPIALSHDVSMMELLLNSAIKADPNNESIGGLFQRNNKDIPVIQYIVSSLGREVTWNTIKKVLARWNTNYTIIHKVIVDAPKELEIALTTFPDAYYLRDKNGRLPIHMALAMGLNWSLPLLFLMSAANFRNCVQNDPVSGFSPIALAALEPSCDLDTIYHLVRSHPEQIEESLF